LVIEIEGEALLQMRLRRLVSSDCREKELVLDSESISLARLKCSGMALVGRFLLFCMPISAVD
jgi:hypothetical protein